jgi:hypothetical protein
MNRYWFGDRNKLNSYYEPYIRALFKHPENVKVLGIATCPRCYHMEDVMEMGSESETESGPVPDSK